MLDTIFSILSLYLWFWNNWNLYSSNGLRRSKL